MCIVSVSAGRKEIEGETGHWASLCHKHSHFRLLLSWLPISTHTISVHTRPKHTWTDPHTHKQMNTHSLHTHTHCLHTKQRKDAVKTNQDRETNKEKEKKIRFVDGGSRKKRETARVNPLAHPSPHSSIKPSSHRPHQI